jgi:hypothetical protein
MPTKKQRRREQKARRHDYEYVYVDDEGHEVSVDPEVLAAERRAKKEDTVERPKARAQGRAKTPAGRGRAGRVIEPPSWRRVGRRALIFGPILIVAMMLLNRNLPLAQRVAPALFMLALFLPFSYFTDSMAYRMYRKRLDQRDSRKS